MDFSPPSAHLPLGALHRGLQASSGVSLATGAMCRLSKLLFLHQVSLVARIMLRKEKKGTDPFQYEWISTVCLCSPGCKKKRCAYWNNIFFLNICMDLSFSLLILTEKVQGWQCAWPIIVSHCHSCLCTNRHRGPGEEVCMSCVLPISSEGVQPFNKGSA